MRKKFKLYVDRAVGVAYSPVDNALLATCGDRSLKLLNVNTGKQIVSHAAHEGSVEAVAYSPDGKLLATGGDDACVRFWSGKTGEPLTGIPQGGVINCLDFSGDGAQLVTGSCSRSNRADLRLQWRVSSPIERFAFSNRESDVRMGA